ncbi:MAG: putative rane protein [Acidobacteriota bacterium]|jgi:putative membrane protein|nr:putative rane protein [Acidobacteriota bacterium]
MSKSLITAATLTGLLALAPAFAQTATTGTSSSKTTTSSATTSNSSGLSSSDRKFIKDAAEGGMMEVELGRIAASKGTDPDVKTFGQRMVDDHSKANDQLKQVASSKGVTVPPSLPASKQKDIDKFNKLSGAAFDSAYVSHMVADHKKDVAEFKKESKSGKDADVKSFASTTLPTLQDHLKMIQDISSKLHPSHAASHTTKTTTKKSGS